MFILTNELLEECHPASTYLHWVKQIIAKVRDETKGLEQIRLRRGLAKKLMEEALPIGHLARHYFGDSNDVQISLRLGNQNYDATVRDCRRKASGVSHIEVTQAMDESDYLRMHQLHNTGEVRGFGKVQKSGTTRNNLQVKISEEMFSQSVVLEREKTLLCKAIEGKLNKHYPPRTLLLIAFDDTMAHGRADNIESLEAVLNHYLSQLTTFHTIALVGLYGGLFIVR